jgi:hypothetical protein
MPSPNSIVAIFSDHTTAERAVKEIAAEGFAMTDLSIVGKGYHTDEKVMGFYNLGDRVAFWGSRGALWGGLWGLFLGGAVMTIPIAGQVVVLGYLASVAVSALSGAVMLGGASALSAALFSIGIPKDSILTYETALTADSFLVMVRGSDADLIRARTVLAPMKPLTINDHTAERTTAALV